MNLEKRPPIIIISRWETRNFLLTSRPIRMGEPEVRVQSMIGINVNQPHPPIRIPSSTTFNFNSPVIIIIAKAIVTEAGNFLLTRHWGRDSAMTVQVSPG
jgi:hypothetical protein